MRYYRLTTRFISCTIYGEPREEVSTHCDAAFAATALEKARLWKSFRGHTLVHVTEKVVEKDGIQTFNELCEVDED